MSDGEDKVGGGCLFMSAMIAGSLAVAALFHEPLARFDQFLEEHWTAWLVGTITPTAVGLVLFIIGGVLGLIARGKHMSPEELNEPPHAFVRSGHGHSLWSWRWAKVQGVGGQFDVELSFSEVKELIRSGASWRVPQWWFVLPMATGGLLVIFGGFTFAIGFAPAWFKVLIVGMLLYTAVPSELAVLASLRRVSMARVDRSNPMNNRSNNNRRTVIIILLLLLLLVGTGTCIYLKPPRRDQPTNTPPPVDIDLRAWKQQGPKGNGNWVVSEDGRSVMQTINGDPTIFISPDTYLDSAIRGTLKVETTDDDDYIGFVFGYQAPLAENGDKGEFPTRLDFLMLDWKQYDQDNTKEGFALVRVQGEFSSKDPFWDRANTPQFQVLETDFGSGKGWKDDTQYAFELRYEKRRIVVIVDGKTIFDYRAKDGEPDFPAGRFGFYNYSQAEVRYSGFTAQAGTPRL